MKSGTKLIAGVGITDVDYKVQELVNGKNIMCPIYGRWASMLYRCYSPQTQLRKARTYIDCQVHPDWHYLSNFRNWQLAQNPNPLYALDKDLKVYENRVYGPDTCCFISRGLNTLLIAEREKASDLPMSVYSNKNHFIVRMSIGGGKKESFGNFKTVEEAHKQALKVKAEYLLTFIPTHPELEEYIVARSELLKEFAGQITTNPL